MSATPNTSRCQPCVTQKFLFAAGQGADHQAGDAHCRDTARVLHGYAGGRVLALTQVWAGGGGLRVGSGDGMCVCVWLPCLVDIEILSGFARWGGQCNDLCRLFAVDLKIYTFTGLNFSLLRVIWRFFAMHGGC